MFFGLLLLLLLHAPPQVHLIRSLRDAMTKKEVPVNIRQTLLNLAEFMEHEVEVCRVDSRPFCVPLLLFAKHNQKWLESLVLQFIFHGC